MLTCPIDVTLTDGEIKQAKAVALEWYNNAKRNGYRQYDGFVGDSLQNTTNGCYGERAFATATGKYWGRNSCTLCLPDFGHNIQVRCAPCLAPRPPKGFGTMILRPKRLHWTGKEFVDKGDDPRDNFVLVTGNPPYFRILGWELAANIMFPGYLKMEANRPEAWFVPNRALRLDLWRILD